MNSRVALKLSMRSEFNQGRGAGKVHPCPEISFFAAAHIVNRVNTGAIKRSIGQFLQRPPLLVNKAEGKELCDASTSSRRTAQVCAFCELASGRIFAAIDAATASASFTGTALPSWRMLSVHELGKTYSSGKVWMRADSRTVK